MKHFILKAFVREFLFYNFFPSSQKPQPKNYEIMPRTLWANFARLITIFWIFDE